MRLEYTDEQERQLRLTEIDAILSNDEYENEVEKYRLLIEQSFLNGTKDVYDRPMAVVELEEIRCTFIYEQQNDQYLAACYAWEGSYVTCFGDKDLESILDKILSMSNRHDQIRKYLDDIYDDCSTLPENFNDAILEEVYERFVKENLEITKQTVLEELLCCYMMKMK